MCRQHQNGPGGCGAGCFGLAADALGRLWAVHPPYCGLQMICFLGAALMTRRLDVVGFRNTVKTRFADVMEIAVD